MSETFIQILIIFGGIILLTILQRFHYKMLYYLANKYHNLLRFFIKFIIRTGIIVHELSHLTFGVISGAKIKKIELFRNDGGKVAFETKNYIGHLGEYYDRPGFIFQLFFNQIGIFLTSIGPLIVGIISTYIVSYYLNINIYNYKNILGNLYFSEYVILIIYAIFVPSFLLSFQDIKNFIISTQTNLASTIIGSIINTIIFLCFLGFLTFFYDFFLFFGTFYIFIFTGLLAYFSLNIVYFYFRKKFF